MQTESAREYGKRDLVELLTGVVNNAGFGWLDSATNSPLAISADDMPKVYQAVKSYWNNRISNYGENGNSTLYFLPAFEMIEKAYHENNFKLFCEGCEYLLNLISGD